MDETPFSTEEKLAILMDSLRDLRDTLDETISFIDDSMIEIDER
jgi:hypothetical protein